MAKSVNDDSMDAALNDTKNNVTQIHACSSQPTTRTEAVTTFQLASATITSTDFTGPANGDTSGRKLTFDGKTGATIDNSGTATHVAMTDGTRLLDVTTCTSQALTAAGTVDFGSFKREIADPT